MRIFPIAFAYLAFAAAPALADHGEREASARYKAGKQAFEEGNTSKALEELKASIAAKPDSKAYLLLGNALTRASDLDGAKQAFEEFLKLDPKSSKRKTVENLIRELDVLAKTKIQITSTPPGATVYLDLKAEGARGKTPLDLPATPGSHRIMLDLDGYDMAQENVNAVEGQLVPLAVKLRVKGCDLTVEANAPDARARVDGGDPVPTAGPIRIAAGPHKIEVSAAGYKADTQPVTCDATKPVRLPIQLAQASIGYLALKLPPGAAVTVTVDGKPADGAKPIEATPGAHRIEVEQKGVGTWRTTSYVAAGQHVDLEPRFEAAATAVAGTGSAAIEIYPNPFGSAEIRIDRRPVKPGDRTEVAAGEHEVWVGARGHAPYSSKVSVAAGEHVRVEPSLDRRGGTLLALGISALLVAAVCEASALGALFTNDQQLSNHNLVERWQTYEDIGHGAAVGTGVIGIASLVGWLVVTRSVPTAP
jgi:PEGA domain